MGRQLQSAQVSLVAKLGTATVTLADIVNMKPGDIIPLNVPELIEADVDDVGVLQGRYGVLNGRYALKVENFLMQAESEPAPRGEDDV